MLLLHFQAVAWTALIEHLFPRPTTARLDRSWECGKPVKICADNMHTPHRLRTTPLSYFVHVGAARVGPYAAEVVLYIAIGKLFRIAAKVVVETGR